MDRIYKAILLIAVILFMPSGMLNAGITAHPNSLEVTRDGTSTITFTFLLNLPEIFHQIFSPQSNYSAFLKSQIALSDDMLEAELVRVATIFSEQTVILNTSGEKIRLQAWKLPEKKVLREVFKTALVVDNLADNEIFHVDPMPVIAKAFAKYSVFRVQLQLPSVMRPIFVNLKNDKFWLTNQIPMAIVDF